MPHGPTQQHPQPRTPPLPLAAFLASLALWIAENVGTAIGTWLYSGQLPDQMVSLGKLGSWYLLLYVSFVTVTLVSRRALGGSAPNPTSAEIRPNRQRPVRNTE